MSAATTEPGLVIGRYRIFDEIASGGMATVHLGRLRGAVGFARTVAVKRLHPQLARDPDVAAMFLDEARIAARIQHPNVVPVLDVVEDGTDLYLVMDYVQGESLARLVRASRPGVLPPRVAVSVVAQMLHGLHAAHEATDEQGAPLEIVHRDVSPQNVLVGIDGVARVLDFGVAKAAHRAQNTRDGALKGKIWYMAPEQILGDDVDRRADTYAAAVVLWEALTGERLFEGENYGRVVRKVLDEPIAAPSVLTPGLPRALDDVVLRGLDRDPSRRFQTALEFAAALERAVPQATSTMIGDWVSSIASSALMARARRVKEIESAPDMMRRESPTLVPPARSGKHPVATFSVPPPPVSAKPSNHEELANGDASDDAGEDVRFSSMHPPPSMAAANIEAAMTSALAAMESSARPKFSLPPPPALATPCSPIATLLPLADFGAIVPSEAECELAEVQTLAPRGGRKALLLGILLTIVGVLASAFAVTWSLWRHHH